LCANYEHVLKKLRFHRLRTDLMVEECHSQIGGYGHTPTSGYDHADFSDTKVISTYNTSPKRACVEIVGVNTKIGALRVVVINLASKELHFVYLPRDVWYMRMVQASGVNKLKKRIRFYYDVENDQYEWNLNETLEDWRFDNFVEFAKMSTDNELFNNVELLFDESCTDEWDIEEVQDEAFVEDAA
jgi:hypothetical protein